MKVKDIDKLREQLHNDKREAFSKHQVWLMLSEYNTEVPTIDAVPMSVFEEIKAEIKTKYESIPCVPWRFKEYDDGWVMALEYTLEVVDKYLERIRNEEVRSEEN